MPKHVTTNLPFPSVNEVVCGYHAKTVMLGQCRKRLRHADGDVAVTNRSSEAALTRAKMFNICCY